MYVNSYVFKILDNLISIENNINIGVEIIDKDIKMYNKKLVYPAIFKRDEEYIMVSFPDFPECNTQGETFIEAFLAAREALELYLDGMEIYPKATEFEDIKEQGGTRVLLVDAENKF